jgi:hypothetical protein
MTSRPKNNCLVERMELLSRGLSRLVRQIRLSLPYVVKKGMFPGEFASSLRVVHGIERAEPRPFTMDDDPSAIDLSHISPRAFEDLARAAVLGELRVIESVRQVESELVVVIDLSRSMLAGCFGKDGVPRDLHLSKLGSLFYAAAVFLHLGEAARFVMRAIYVTGQGIPSDRTRSPANFSQIVMLRMQRLLERCHEAANRNSDAAEPFSLCYGLAQVLALRVPSVVVVVSDFLDPFDQYAGLLTEIAARRHHLILIDVAATEDRDCPIPHSLWDLRDSMSEVSEGARHLELGTSPRPVTTAMAKEWNRLRQDDARRMREHARRCGARYERFFGMNWQQCYIRASCCLKRIQ